MIHKCIYLLTACMFLWISFLFYGTLRPLLMERQEKVFLSLDDVVHIALVKDGKEEILSFSQELQFLKQLNQLKSLQFALQNDKNRPILFDKILIYRFNQPPLSILPEKENKQTLYICLNNL